ALQTERKRHAEAVAKLDASYQDQRSREKALGSDVAGLKKLLAQLRAAAERAEAERRAAAERARRAAAEAGAPPPKPVPVPAQPALRVGGLGWPLSGSLIAGYGGKLPDGGKSSGLMIGAPQGTTVQAVAPGKVVFADWMNGYGLILIIDHGNGYMSLYARNEALLRDAGDMVERGDPVASVGSSGGPGPPALYFELRRNGDPVNPDTWLKKESARMRTKAPLLLLAAALLSSPLHAQDTQDAARDDATADAEASSVPLDEIRRFVSVYNAVRQAYVEPVSDEELMHAAVKGLLLDLDPHSIYFDKDDAEAFREETSGAYGGIGIEVQPQPDGTILVVAPIDGTPAARAGLKSGDVSVAVDGKPLEAGEDGRGPLRGEPGTRVVLTVAREGRAAQFDVTVTRETIRVASVRSRMLEPGYGYLRIAAFQADTAADFARELASLQKQAGGLKGLVLDLRSNPGGLLVSAVQIADDLLEGGGIVSTRGRIALSDT